MRSIETVRTIVSLSEEDTNPTQEGRWSLGKIALWAFVGLGAASVLLAKGAEYVFRADMQSQINSDVADATQKYTDRIAQLERANDDKGSRIVVLEIENNNLQADIKTDDIVRSDAQDFRPGDNLYACNVISYGYVPVNGLPCEGHVTVADDYTINTDTVEHLTFPEGLPAPDNQGQSLVVNPRSAFPF